MTEKGSWDLPAGDELAPGLVVLERRGGGKRFEVYLVADERRLTTAIVKVLRPERVENPRSLRALRHEADILARLSHPAVVRLFEAVPDGARPHLVLEHVEGPTMRQLRKAVGALQVEQVLPLALGLCAALHYLHGEGFVHLDVKPSNVIAGVSAVLVDFSVARTIEDARALERPIGTGPFMAPEVRALRGDTPPGPPADVWSLGMTLLEAVTGSAPAETGFPGRDAVPRSVPGPVVDAIEACLDPDPGGRPAPAGVAERLEGLVAGLPVVPRLRRARPRLE